MISALTWVPVEKMAPMPVRYEVSQGEMQMLKKELEEDLRGEDEPMEEEPEVEMDQEEGEMAELGSLSDEEDYKFKDSDFVLLVAQNQGAEGDDSEEPDDHTLEVQVYDSEEQNIFVHHDFPLPEMAIALQWIPMVPEQERGSFLAIGTLQPEVELWNLDVVDILEPAAILPGHTGPVTALSWVSLNEKFLLSSSADCTVRMWDISSGQLALTKTQHTREVQSVAWNRSKAHVAASAGSDRVVWVFDVRSSEPGLKQTCCDELELIKWNPHNSAIITTVLDSGLVQFYDIRKLGSPLVEFSPHRDQAESVVLSYNETAQNIIATGSFDGTCKLWDLNGSAPALLASREMEIGSILSVEYAPRDKFVLGAAGSSGSIAVWDTSENADVEKRLS